MTATDSAPRVLILDDDPDIGELLADLATRAGFEPVVTQAPAPFFDELARGKPDLIVLDLQMPEADGIEILRELAANRCRASLYIVSGMDGRTIASAEQFARQSGLNVLGVANKPFSPESMLEKFAAARQASTRLTSSELEQSLQNGEMRLYFQPVIQCVGGDSWHAESAEALLRWHHPRLGRLTPAQFLGLVESDRGELMRQLTDFVLLRSIEQLHVWQRSGHHVGVRVNVAAALIGDANFPDRLETMLKEHNVDPDLLTLEIHDLPALSRSTRGVDILTRLRLKSVRLALDDFGADTASLRALITLPVGEVKIDRLLVECIDTIDGAKTLVAGLVDTLQRMDIVCCAVGVERPAQLAVLGDIGCNRAQGFLVGEPMMAGDLSRVLEQWAAVRGEAVEEMYAAANSGRSA